MKAQASLHHRLREPRPLALRIAAPAGAEAGGLRLAAVAEEPDVLAQRTRRRTAGPAEHAHGGDGIEEVSGLPADDLVPELIVRQTIDHVCVFHAAILGHHRAALRHPRIALTRAGLHSRNGGRLLLRQGRRTRRQFGGVRTCAPMVSAAPRHRPAVRRDRRRPAMREAGRPDGVRRRRPQEQTDGDRAHLQPAGPLQRLREAASAAT